MTLNEKNAVITGGASGIGYEVCKRLLENDIKYLAIIDIQENVDSLGTLRADHLIIPGSDKYHPSYQKVSFAHHLFATTSDCRVSLKISQICIACVIMRLGGAHSGGDPLTMSVGNDYAELCDLGPSRWSSRGYHPPHSSLQQHIGMSSTGGMTGGTSHLSSNSFEAEDIVGPGDGGGIDSGSVIIAGEGGGSSGPYGLSTRIGNSTSSLRGRSGLYYSPPGTSYTIVERPHSPHYYYNTAGGPTKGVSLPNRGGYLSSSSSSHIASSLSVGTSGGGSGGGSGGAVQNSTRHNSKKRPISPEQVLRMFGSSTSASVPTSYHYSNGTRDRGRRSPASSPPSTTHQIYRDRDRDCSVPNNHELSTRTVTMSRDQQPDGSHGFGICVKGGKDSGLFGLSLMHNLPKFCDEPP